jgi:hypothetical protein
LQLIAAPHGYNKSRLRVRSSLYLSTPIDKFLMSRKVRSSALFRQYYWNIWQNDNCEQSGPRQRFYTYCGCSTFLFKEAGALIGTTTSNKSGSADFPSVNSPWHFSLSLCTVTISRMPNLEDIVQQLRQQRDRLTAAITVLTSLNGRKRQTAKRNVSASSREKMRRAQKARRERENKPATVAPKRTMSASARRKIAAAQRARWATVKAKAKKAA